MSRTNTLRLNGYRVDSEGRIECRAGVEVSAYGGVTKSDAARLEQTYVAIISIEVERGDARVTVDKLIEAADSPRALIGRKRDGSAVLLFKCGNESVSKRVEEFGTRDGKVRFTIEVQSAGATLDLSTYTWTKERSPEQVERDRLQTLTDDVPSLVFAATETVGCAPWSMVEYWSAAEAESARLAARIASGERFPTREDLEIAEQEQLVADNEGRDVGIWDGNWAAMLINARKLVAARRKAKADAA